MHCQRRRFPPPGTLLTPVFPAPTNARTFVILRLLGVLVPNLPNRGHDVVVISRC